MAAVSNLCLRMGVVILFGSDNYMYAHMPSTHQLNSGPGELAVERRFCARREVGGKLIGSLSHS